MKRLILCAVVACGGSQKQTSPILTEGPSASSSAMPAGAEASRTKHVAAATQSLFQRLGGLPAVTAVVDDFVNRNVADPRVNQRFFNSDPVDLKRLLTEFVCKATGGPCTYSGRGMQEVHAGMDLVDDEFNAVVENLQATLDKFKVPQKEQGELLGAFGPLKSEMVVSADKLKPMARAQLDKVTKLAATLKDPQVVDLLRAAVVAGERGQRSYAEQLFSRAELAAGPKALAAAAPVFREGAPPRVATATKKVKSGGPQPAAVGSSEADDPDRKPQLGSLRGSLVVDGKAPTGLGVVMLWPTKGPVKKRTAKIRVIEQKDKAFAPHVIAVPVGSTVQFPNFDTIFHNVFSISRQKQFDLGMYKNSEMREVKFDKAGIVRLGCNIHANMSAYVVVVDAPHYVVASADGAFAFKSLAPGKYKVQAWGEQSAEPTVTEIEIKSGDNQARVDLKGGASAGPSADKFGASRG